ncbi:hypothetical protein BHM03_00026628, partial [Ensete ventricosum]
MQGLQFRPVPPSTGGTYRSARLSVHGPPATGRFRQKSVVGGRLRKKKGRRGKGKKKEEGKKEYLASAVLACRRRPQSRPRLLFLQREETRPAGCDRCCFFSRARRQIEVAGS